MRSQRRHPRQGQVVITFALTFMLLLVALVTMVADLASAYGVSSTIRKAAQAGADAGAADIDINCYQMHTCPLQLKAGAADACSQAIHDTDPNLFPLNTGYCQWSALTPASITANPSATWKYPVGIPGLSSLTIAATATAFAQIGTNTPS